MSPNGRRRKREARWLDARLEDAIEWCLGCAAEAAQPALRDDRALRVIGRHGPDGLTARRQRVGRADQHRGAGIELAHRVEVVLDVRASRMARPA